MQWVRWEIRPWQSVGGETGGIVIFTEDITERRQAEEALRESEVRYRELVQNAHSAIIRWRSDGTITFFNEYAQEFFGWSAAEALGRHIGILVPDRDASGADLSGLVREIVEHPERHRQVVNENVCRDGRRVWMSWTNGAIFDEEGEVAEIFAVGSDITERKRVEDALLESEQRFRLALRNAPVSVAMQDCDLRYVWAYNQRTAKSDEILGKLDADIFTPEEAGRLEAIKRKVIEEDIEIRQQMWFDRPSGRIFLDVCWEPVHDEAGRVIGVGSATVDLTPMKLAGEELRESELRYRTVGETIPYGIWQADATGACTYASDSFLEMTGLSWEQLQEFGWLHLLPEEDREPTSEHWLRCVRSGEDFQREHRFRAADGSTRHVLAIGRPVRNERGDITNWVGINLDITERKQAEEALRTSEEQFRIMFEGSSVGMAQADPATARFLRVNDALCELTGYAREELLQRTFGACSHNSL